MNNFKDEKFPVLGNFEDFDAIINKIEKEIVSNKTVEKILKENPQNIPKGPGAYFFYDTAERKIVYVGISRKIKNRLQQHINHKSSLSASLAYLMAKHELEKIKSITEIKESFEKPDNEDNCRNKHQKKIKNFKVAFKEFDNHFELALFEIYSAIKMQCFWNSFKTH